MANKVAVVTGSNKGVGLSTVRELCKRGVEYVYLTARDVQRGREAIEKLNKEGYNPQFHQLDITDEISVKKFAEYVKQKHGGLDILINNAAIKPATFGDTSYVDSQRVLNNNYYSFQIVEKYIFPILKNNARVINVSSDDGHIFNLKNTYWVDRLTKENLRQEDVDAFVHWFLESIKKETLNKDHFEDMYVLAYKISKIATCALTIVLQSKVGRGISVNSLLPGFDETYRTKIAGDLTITKASDTLVYLALDIDQSVKGKFFGFDKIERNWAEAKQKVSPNINKLFAARKN